jgi:hypothetical protein
VSVAGLRAFSNHPRPSAIAKFLLASEDTRPKDARSREAAMSAVGENAVDYVQILQLQATYARGVDRVDGDLLRSVYWEDATDDHGSFVGEANGFVAGLVSRLPKNYLGTQHLLGQTYVHSLDDRHATTETYFRASHQTVNTAEADFIINGRYLDLLEKRGGVWKILRRELIFDQYVQVTFTACHIDGQVYSNRQSLDRSYDFFARMHEETAPVAA